MPVHSSITKEKEGEQILEEERMILRRRKDDGERKRKYMYKKIRGNYRTLQKKKKKSKAYKVGTSINELPFPSDMSQLKNKQ